MPGRDAATVRELLAQAPPGELRNVASDVRALLGDEQVQTPLPLQNGRARASIRKRLADGIARPPWHQTHPRIWRRDSQMCASLCQDAASQGNGRLPHFDALAAWHASQGVSPSMACSFG